MFDLGAPLDAAVEPGTNLLVTGPPMSGKQRLGYDALGGGLDAGERAVVVTNREPAARVRERRGDQLRGGPVGVVDCVSSKHGGATPDADAVQFVGAPDDMTGIGIAFSELVDVLPDAPVRVLFDSVSTLLLYTDLQTAFRFLHVFTSRVARLDGLGLFLLESDAHDEHVRNTLGQLFDGVVTLDADGSVSSTL